MEIWQETALALYAEKLTVREITKQLALKAHVVKEFLTLQNVLRDDPGERHVKGYHIPFRKYTEKKCDACKQLFQPNAQSQRFCTSCTVGRGGHFLKIHGITQSDFDTLIKGQNGECAICHRVLSELPRSQVHIDHDHSTGRIRGIICMKCNLKLSVLEDETWCAEALKFLKAPGGITPRCPCRNLKRIRPAS